MENKKLQIELRYATETSTTFEISYQFYQIFHNYIHSFEQLNHQQPKFLCNPHHQNQILYIFIIATTGYGDPPYSMRAFWKSLMSKNFTNGLNSSNTPLEGMNFAVFGLGDRSYGDNYNITSRKLRQRLLMLGASQIFEIGLGDEQDRAGNYQQFRSYFIPSLTKYLEDHKLQPYKSSIPKQDLLKEISSYRLSTQQNDRFEFKESKLLSRVGDREIYWVVLKYLSKDSVHIGDTLNIHPQNSTQLVDKMADYFLTNNLNDLNLSEDSIKQYLANKANLSNVLNFSFFRKSPDCLKTPELHEYISVAKGSDKSQQIQKLLTDKLIELQTDFNEYYHYIKKYSRNVCEVVVDFNLKIPISQFIRRLGNIIPRKYSIASVEEDKNFGELKIYQLGLLVKLEKREVFGNRLIEGLCSKDLIETGLKADTEKQHKFFRKGRILRNGQFYLKQINQPLTLISLGTGIAPFLPIIFQYSKLLSQQVSQLHNLLMFHSYKYQQEVPFKETLQKLSQLGILKQYITYTRQSNLQNIPINNVKQYIEKRIQKVIQEQNELIEIKKMLEREGRIFICGNKQFIQYIFSILKKKLGWNIPQLRKKKIIAIQNW